MAKTANTVGSLTVTVTLSEQSVTLLGEIAQRGVFGRNPAEVAGRLVDKALTEQFLPPLKFKHRKGPRKSEK